jgi:CRISPR-associated Csx2 family protein
MKRKLISFLGTGFYYTARYYHESENGLLEYETPFVQLALTHIFKPDEVVVFLTPQAESMNWLGEKRPDKRTGKEYPETGLMELSQNHFPEVSFVPVQIPNEQTEEDIWKIFEKFQEHLDDGESIIFDVTHSFRSIPIMSLACLHYVRSFRNVNLQGIYYGNWEAKENREDDLSPRAPVINLTPFVDLMDWSMAVSEFISYGQSGLLKKLIDSGSDSFDAKRKGQLRSLAAALDKTSKSIVGCRGRDIFSGEIWKDITRLTEKLRKSKDQTIPAVTPLLDLIDQKINSLIVEEIHASQEVKNGLGVVRWCLEHNHIQQAYAILQETLITHLCDLGGIDPSNRDMRQLAAQCVKVREEEDRNNWHKPAKDNLEKVDEILDKAGDNFFKLYKNLSDLRNDVMHCRLKSDKDYSHLRKQINGFYKQTVKIMAKQTLPKPR